MAEGDFEDRQAAIAYRRKHGLKPYQYRTWYGEKWQVYETMSLNHVAMEDYEANAQAIADRLNQATEDSFEAGRRQGIAEAIAVIQKCNWSDSLNHHAQKDYREARTGVVKEFLCRQIRALLPVEETDGND